MPDYEADLPLWGLDWEAPDLPWPMLLRLTKWQDTFDTHFDPFSGWDSESVRNDWAAEATHLIDDLHSILGPDRTLEVDLWPLNPQEP